MIKLVEVNEKNYFEEILKLRLREEQKKYLDSVVGIVARAHIYKDCNPKLFAIKRNDDIVGLIFIKDLYDEPACYDFQQILIDERFQSQGIGKESVKLALDILIRENRFNRVDVSINKENIASINIFKSNGFCDTGYVCDSCKENINLSYSIDKSNSFF